MGGKIRSRSLTDLGVTKPPSPREMERTYSSGAHARRGGVAGVKWARTWKHHGKKKRGKSRAIGPGVTYTVSQTRAPTGLRSQGANPELNHSQSPLEKWPHSFLGCTKSPLRSAGSIVSGPEILPLPRLQL